MNTDTIIFFNKQPDALPLYEAFADAVTKLYPETEIRVQKTQISFYDVHMFACVSFVRVKKRRSFGIHIWWSRWGCRIRLNPPVWR